MSALDPRLLGVIDVDVFNTEVGVFRSLEDCASYLAERGAEVEAETRRSHGMARKDMDGEGVAWWSLVITDGASEATRAHECVHIADFLMDHLGIPTGAENTEVRAYLTGHLFGELQGLLA